MTHSIHGNKRWLALDRAVPRRADDRARHDDRERRAAVDPRGPGFTETSLVWVVNAYMLTFGGFLLLGGRLGDLFGHRRLFLLGITLFTLASLGLRARELAAAADRRARRAGAGRRRRLRRRAVADHEPVHRAGASARRRWASTASSCAGGGSIGVLLGGLLTERVDWHWIFLVNLPIGVAVVRACVALLPAGRSARADRAGSMSPARSTVTASLMLAVYAIVNGNDAGWTSVQTLGLLGAAPSLLCASFLVIEARVPRAADAAAPVPAAQRRHRQRRRRAVGGRDVRVVLHLGAVPAARARLQRRCRSGSRSCRPT